MVKIFLSVLFLFFAVLANADTCDNLIGTYKGVANDEFQSEYNKISIGYNDNGSALLITYQLGENSPQNTAEYITDGAEHMGDGRWSGTPYTAVCDGNAIKINNVFKELKEPLVFNFYLNGSELNLEETVGTYSRQTGKLLRTH